MSATDLALRHVGDLVVVAPAELGVVLPLPDPALVETEVHGTSGLMSETANAYLALRHAVAKVAAVLGDGMLNSEVGPAMSCGEIEPLVALLVICGHTDEAASFIEGHGGGDCEDEDEHHDIYEEGL